MTDDQKPGDQKPGDKKPGGDAADRDAPIAPDHEAAPRSSGAPSVGGERDVVHAPTVVEVPVVDQPKAESHEQNQDEDRFGSVLREILGGTPMVSLLAVVVAFVVGGVLIAATDEAVQDASGYFFARPGDTLAAIASAVGGAYWALFQGSIFNFSRPEGGFVAFIRPLTETLHFAAPLIAAGLGVAVAFRVGMFNIGGRGQMLAAAAAAGWVGFSFPMPPVLHAIAAVAAGMVAGALWAGIAGLLKARTGAHEVITTIMLNFVALWLLSYLIRTPGLLQAPGSNNPITPGTLESAQLPELFGPQFNVTWGIVLSVLAVVVAWWLIDRSSLGFRFRAVGLNPQAALNAGMDVKGVYVQAMLVAGAFMGLAGAQQVQATVTTGFTSGIDAGIGFDAITVALLGRSNPWGVLAAGLLFGAFKAGGFRMQAAEGVPIDIVLVVQSVIVLCIAAPPLVRTIFRLPKPRGGAR